MKKELLMENIKETLQTNIDSIQHNSKKAEYYNSVIHGLYVGKYRDETMDELLTQFNLKATSTGVAKGKDNDIENFCIKCEELAEYHNDLYREAREIVISLATQSRAASSYVMRHHRKDKDFFYVPNNQEYVNIFKCDDVHIIIIFEDNTNSYTLCTVKNGMYQIEDFLVETLETSVYDKVKELKSNGFTPADDFDFSSLAITNYKVKIFLDLSNPVDKDLDELSKVMTKLKSVDYSLSDAMDIAGALHQEVSVITMRINKVIMSKMMSGDPEGVELSNKLTKIISA